MFDRGPRWANPRHWVFLAAFAAAACGGAKPNQATATKERNEDRAQRSLERARESTDPERFRVIISRFPNTQAASSARDELATLLVGQAEKAMAAEDWVTAEERAVEAKQHGGVEMTLKASKVLDALDDKRASKVADETLTAAAEGKCASALKTVAATIRKKPRARYTTEVRKLTKAGLLACLDKKIQASVEAGSIEEARTMLETPDATTAFANEGYREANGLLEKAVVKLGMKDLKPLLAQKQWKDAVTKLEELRAKDVMNPRERDVAFEIIQDEIKAHLLARLEAGLTAKDPKDVASEVDATLPIAAWKNVPEDVRKARDALVVNLECQRLGCKLGKPAPLWAWGKVPMFPPTSAEGSKRAVINHAQKVWSVGRSGTWALIVREDPGSLEDKEYVKKAEGWVPTENMKANDTDDWMPPKDDMKGVQVWGPLLEKEPDTYILGTVQSVEGDDVTVKRITDGLDAKVKWGKLRLGKLNSGLKVFAFCVDQIHRETAKVDSIVAVAAGIAKVKVKCDKGNIERVEIASALSTRAAWLPPRKP